MNLLDPVPLELFLYRPFSNRGENSAVAVGHVVHLVVTFLENLTFFAEQWQVALREHIRACVPVELFIL